VIDLQQLHGCTVDFDERDQHTRTRAVRFDADVLTDERGGEIVDFESDVRHRLHEIGIRRVVPVALPLDPERIVLVIADRDLQMRERNLAVERANGGDPDVIELGFHAPRLPDPSRCPPAI